MPNSKQSLIKRKHRRRKQRQKDLRVQQIGNAKKKTMRKMNESGSLPKIYKNSI
tara:strand:- start:1136 stop:1297 length:162 start_codon:yes stop_codon:yes gene_type:complete